jgi:hypothetical protein
LDLWLYHKPGFNYRKKRLVLVFYIGSLLMLVAAFGFGDWLVTRDKSTEVNADVGAGKCSASYSIRIRSQELEKILG